MEEMKKCSIVSGSPLFDKDYLKNNLEPDSFVIAADSGYKKLEAIGVIPDLIMGDFDSAPKPDINCEIISLPCEKDYSDTFYCVREALKRDYKNICIYFALGGRFDHTYSNVLCLDYCKKHSAVCTLCDNKNRLSLISEKYSFKKEYKYFSLYAYLEDCYGIKIEGAYYTAGFYGKDELDIMRYDLMAQSNFVNSDLCTVSLKKGTLLLVESND